MAARVNRRRIASVVEVRLSIAEAWRTSWSYYSAMSPANLATPNESILAVVVLGAVFV